MKLTQNNADRKQTKKLSHHRSYWFLCEKQNCNSCTKCEKTWKKHYSETEMFEAHTRTHARTYVQTHTYTQAAMQSNMKLTNTIMFATLTLPKYRSLRTGYAGKNVCTLLLLLITNK